MERTKRNLAATLAACVMITCVACSETTLRTPAPFAGPTGTPQPGALVLTPSSLSFLAVGASSAQPVAASESNYSGTFAASTASAGATNSCSGIAAISPSSGTSFTVTPQTAGGCVFTFTDASGKSATLTVNVTTTSVGGT